MNTWYLTYKLGSFYMLKKLKYQLFIAKHAIENTILETIRSQNGIHGLPGVNVR